MMKTTRFPKTIVFLFAIIFLAVSCSSKNQLENIATDFPQMKEMAQFNTAVPVDDGIWSDEAKACISPATNCSVSSRFSQPLNDAIITGTFSGFLQSAEGKEWLETLHPVIATDLVAGDVILKTFPDTEGYVFFVYKNATHPHDGPNYSYLIEA
jgi:hypothetical protein